MRNFSVICLLFLLYHSAFSQDRNPSAKFYRDLSHAASDTDKVKIMLKFCSVHVFNPDTTVYYAKKAYQLAELTGRKDLIVESYETVGDAHWYRREYNKASEYYLKELGFAEKHGLKKYIGRALYNIGWIKSIQKHSFKDRNYLIRALRIFESLGDTSGILEVYNGLAGLYQLEFKKDSTLLDSANYYFRNLVFFSESISGRYNVPVHMNYAGFLYKQGKYADARHYLYKCVEVARKSGDSVNYYTSKMSLAITLYAMDSVEKAVRLAVSVQPYVEKHDIPEALDELYEFMMKYNVRIKDYKKAYDYQSKLFAIKERINTSLYESNLVEKEAEFEIEKRENSIKRLEHQNELEILKNKHSMYAIAVLVLVAICIIILSIHLFRSNKIKQETNLQLNIKSQQIEQQKKMVEERNHDITNSINYAKRIQDAILPARELKFKLFPDAFVMFLPKDIVSGDFYWFTEKNGKRIIAAIDCTGHGVPGAFMSLIGNTFLHEIINEKGVTNPSEILNQLRNKVISSLKQTDVIDSTKDGMDMALLVFNDENNSVEYAGANNPLWVIRNGQCLEFKADKRPIGFFKGAGLPFTNHVMQLEKGDRLYLFSDGYADQFGGPRGKKFKYKQLEELLISLGHLPMLEQEKVLLDRFNAWKGDLEQVDDVCVIGIRV